MPVSYPNQRTICIHKETPKATKENKRPYMIAYIDLIEAAARNIHKPSSFKLYMYLISNVDGYTFALSTQDFSEKYGISQDSAKDAVNDLIALGYLVQRQKRTYDFYESPKLEDIEPVIEVKKQFKTKSGEVLELTLNELIDKVGKDKAEEAWRKAQ